MIDNNTDNESIAEQLARECNEYKGGNIWESIIYNYSVDMRATEAADPSCRSDVIVLKCGSKVEHFESEGKWRVVIDAEQAD